jgi:hypothetical protein
MNFDFRLPTRLENYPNNRWQTIFTIEAYDNRRYLDNITLGLGLRY